MLSIRDPVHGFIRADPLEAALIDSRPLQRLRWIHQLGLTFMVFPGAEHSRFSHALGAMHLAGRLYDALAANGDAPLPPGPTARERRLVRAAALLHDVGHAPFSHSAEEQFEDGIDHEEMTRRLLGGDEIGEIFDRHGDGVTAADVARVLGDTRSRTAAAPAPLAAAERVLGQIVSGELDADKMDYLLRDSLFCGVQYGSYDLERLLDTVVAIQDPETGGWGIGVDEGGVHALEALVMARYYMFTQVYFSVIGKALELHLARWLEEERRQWSADPERFLAEDDLTVTARMRASSSPHAAAVVRRGHWPLAFETGEHLDAAAKQRFDDLLPDLDDRFGRESLLISNASKDPHRLGSARVLVRRGSGDPEPMERSSHFIRHLHRIQRYRVYAPAALRDRVAAAIAERWA